MKLRVASYNIHKGVSVLRGLPRIHAQKQAIGEFDAELVFLQEVQGHLSTRSTHKRSREVPESEAAQQHVFLAGNDYQVAYGMNAKYLHGHHGNALLSVFPIVAMNNRNVSDHVFEQRGILHCELELAASRLHCFVVHLGLFEGGRGRQAQALIETVEELAPGDAPVVIAGDFNDWRNSLGVTLQDALKVTEVFSCSGSDEPAKTFPAMLPILRLDRMYVRGFDIETAQVHSGRYWARLSDHSPIVASLSLK